MIIFLGECETPSNPKQEEIEKPLNDISKSDSDNSRTELWALSDFIEHNSTEEDSFTVENKI